MTDPTFARSSESDPLGKCDVRMDTLVPEKVKDDAAFVARAQGFRSTSEWVRSIIERELYGSVEHIQSVVRGIGSVKGRNGG